jgi:hypothetical protein
LTFTSEIFVKEAAGAASLCNTFEDEDRVVGVVIVNTFGD